ncbi:N-terminal EF-hand calcium-binding protein 3 isoform X1 [Ailuropoda melanoleuca]|uniref:N-terminal EF-hand calcium-binding protein 3 isoform X1 n=1 Tax=Ailuropoda melanoleuca TaxID=9646 RepID=UPI001494BB3A|nr:N-terminal EF-hand calcium-binding protein 3 isoform X1 [Ailuropoda melanoleuca]
MACAGLLTVCLIRPPAPEPRRPPAPAAGPAGHALFQDVFRRADKNDDGKLSFEEFQNYFADGVLSPGELRELFNGIDGHSTNNLETERLCDYFSEHLGVYRPVLAALESLNCAVLTAMDTTKLEYERASKVDQFVTRFLLRETVSQLQALQSSLEGASDTLEAQARGPRSDEDSVEVQSRPHGSRRAGRRALRSIGRSPTWSPGSSPSLDTGQSSEAEMQWRLQVNRLQELIDQLECKAPRLEPLHEEKLTKGPESGGSLASTSSWPSGRCRWQRKPCRISTAPCAATWTSRGPRAIACTCLPRRWTMPLSPYMSSGRMRPPGEGTSILPVVRPSSASSLTTFGLRTPSPLCSSQPPGGL